MQESSATERYRRVERSCGDFERSVRLPDGVGEADIHSKVADGVLPVKIALPRASETRGSRSPAATDAPARHGPYGPARRATAVGLCRFARGRGTAGWVGRAGQAR